MSEVPLWGSQQRHLEAGSSWPSWPQASQSQRTACILAPARVPCTGVPHSQGNAPLYDPTANFRWRSEGTEFRASKLRMSGHVQGFAHQNERDLIMPPCQSHTPLPHPLFVRRVSLLSLSLSLSPPPPPSPSSPPAPGSTRDARPGEMYRGSPIRKLPRPRERSGAAACQRKRILVIRRSIHLCRPC